MRKRNRLLHPLPVAVLVAILVIMATRTFVIDAAVVSGTSMAPTLMPGSIIVILRCAYGVRNPGGGYLLFWSSPRTGDVVVSLNPQTGESVVKRVVASLPGLSRQESSLFLMGDNPGESLDSRKYGLVPVESILGRVLLSKPWVNR